MAGPVCREPRPTARPIWPIGLIDGASAVRGTGYRWGTALAKQLPLARRAQQGRYWAVEGVGHGAQEVGFVGFDGAVGSDGFGAG